MRVRSILDRPSIYRMFAHLVGGKGLSVFVKHYVAPRLGDRIIDIGCGPGNILELLPREVDYVGFDISADYIDAAKSRFGERGTFFCDRVRRDVLRSMESFDLAIAAGILHHLTDEEALDLMELARTSLKSGGRLVTLDGCFHEDQSRLSRFVVAMDRGRFIRTPWEYRRLAEHSFDEVKVTVLDNLIRIPYSHTILECTAP